MIEGRIKYTTLVIGLALLILLPCCQTLNFGNGSPWGNFHEDFENRTLRRFNTEYSILDRGRKNYRFEQEPSGNTYLVLSVWDGIPNGRTTDTTERTELATYYSEKAEDGGRMLGRTVWYGFRVRAPQDLQLFGDRVLFTQFKPQFSRPGGGGGNVPTFAMHLYSDSHHEILIHSEKNIGKIFKLFGPGRYGVTVYDSTKRKGLSDVRFTSSERFPAFPLVNSETWTCYKVGVYFSKSESGWVKVYKNGRLILLYQGMTWHTSPWEYSKTAIRISLYRDRCAFGYPEQELHFDDFTVGSTEQYIDEHLDFGDLTEESSVYFYMTCPNGREIEIMEFRE